MITRLVKLIGETATLALVDARGGRSVYVPERPVATSELAKIVGLDAATKLGQEFGREAITVPIAREWRILLYSDQGPVRSADRGPGRRACRHRPQGTPQTRSVSGPVVLCGSAFERPLRGPENTAP